MDAILIRANMTLEIKPQVSADFHLSPQVEKLSVQVDSVRTLFKQDPLVTPQQIEQTLASFIDTIRNLIN